MKKIITSAKMNLAFEKRQSNLSALIIEYPMSWPLYNLQARQALNLNDIYEYHHFSANNALSEIRNSYKVWEYPEMSNAAISCLILSAKTFAGLVNIFASRSLRGKQAQVNNFCRISYGNVIIGDQLLSQYLRRSTSGQVAFETKNILSLIKLSIKIPFFYYSLRKRVDDILRTLKKGVRLKVICMIPHEVRYEQILRRIVYYSFGSDPRISLYEIVLDKDTRNNTLRSFSSAENYLMSRRSIKRYDGLKSEFVDYAMKIMGERLSDKCGHVYFHTGNTNPEYDIESNNTDIGLPEGFPSVMDKMIVLPLHQVSDDQFLFGFDDLGDIASYHDSIIDFCASRSLPLLIKHHPNAYNPKLPDKSLIEKNYMNYIMTKYFKPKERACRTHKSSVIASGIYPNLFLIPPKVSIVSFLAPYKNALIISRHGNVIVEAIYSGCPFMCSKYSRYNNFPLGSISIYKGRCDLFDTIDRYLAGKYQASDFVVSDKSLIESIVASAYKSNMVTEGRLNDRYLEPYFYPATSGTALAEDWRRAFSKLQLDRFQSLSSTSKLQFTSSEYKDLFSPIESRD